MNGEIRETYLKAIKTVLELHNQENTMKQEKKGGCSQPTHVDVLQTPFQRSIEEHYVHTLSPEKPGKTQLDDTNCRLLVT